MNIQVESITLPHKALTNFELIEACKELNVKNFKGVFMRDQLPKRCTKNTCGILNLDDNSGSGTHWVCWFKKGPIKLYFDSYGLPPPKEILTYLGKGVQYPTEQIQKSGVICGHLCLFVLCRLSQGQDLQSIVNELY
tara:strand:+ start:2738 stop:3148 length:411 start_codon:yes stop_codon:yes gene_type:complete